MFSNQNTNPVERQLQQNNTTLSSEDLLKHMQSLEKRIKSLEVTNRVILGLFIGTLAAAITVGAGFAIAAAPIIAGSIVGGILATVALAALGVTAYKYRAQIKEGFKYAAEKTVDGAKYTAGKVRDGAVHVRDSVKEAVSSVGQATREGTSSALRAMGDGVQELGRKMSNSGVSMSSLDSIPYSIGNEGQTVVLKTEEKTRNFNSVKEMFIKEVLEDKAVNNSALTKEIFSKLGEKILEKACSVDGQQSAKKDQLINQLKQQVDFVNKLDAKKLQNLLSKDNNSLYEIFSEHHDEIKEVIAKCKEDHILKGSLKMRNNMFEEVSARPSRSSSFSSVFSLGRKDSTQSTSSLSKSSSLRTESTVSSEAELLNPAKHKEVKTTASLWDRVSSPFKSGKKSGKTSEVEYQSLESGTSSRRVGESTFYVAPPKPPRSNSLNSIGTVSTDAVPGLGSDNFATVNPNRLRRSNSSSSLSDGSPQLTPAAPPKVPGSPFIDSGMGSGSSTPTSPLGKLKQSSSKDEISAAMEKNLEEFSSNAKTESTQSSLSNRNGSDSGFNSPSDSPTRTILNKASGGMKTQADLNLTSHTLWEQPSSKVDEVKPESTQVKIVG